MRDDAGTLLPAKMLQNKGVCATVYVLGARKEGWVVSGGKGDMIAILGQTPKFHSSDPLQLLVLMEERRVPLLERGRRRPSISHLDILAGRVPARDAGQDGL